jgi:hypothetical protein
MEQLDSHWTDFGEISYLGFFSNIYLENTSFIKIRQELRVVYMKKFDIYDHMSLNSD